MFPGDAVPGDAVPEPVDETFAGILSRWRQQFAEFQRALGEASSWEAKPMEPGWFGSAGPSEVVETWPLEDENPEAFVQRIKRELGIESGPLGSFEEGLELGSGPGEEVPLSSAEVLRQIQAMSRSFEAEAVLDDDRKACGLLMVPTGAQRFDSAPWATTPPAAVTNDVTKWLWSMLEPGSTPWPAKEHDSAPSARNKPFVDATVCRHPDGDLQGSEALLCHKMLVAAKDGREELRTTPDDTGRHSHSAGPDLETLATTRRNNMTPKNAQDELKMLLEQGLPVDRRRPFFMKREQEDVEVVAPANARRVHGMTALMKHGQESEPLHFAATSGSLYVCELLIQHRADVEDTWPPLCVGRPMTERRPWIWCRMTRFPPRSSTSAGRSFWRQMHQRRNLRHRRRRTKRTPMTWAIVQKAWTRRANPRQPVLKEGGRGHQAALGPEAKPDDGKIATDVVEFAPAEPQPPRDDIIAGVGSNDEALLGRLLALEAEVLRLQGERFPQPVESPGGRQPEMSESPRRPSPHGEGEQRPTELPMSSLGLSLLSNSSLFASVSDPGLSEGGRDSPSKASKARPPSRKMR
eukprot:g30703.t1